MLDNFNALDQDRPNLLTLPNTKPVYQDSSILVMALVQGAWQMSYEEVVDYFRAHGEAAQAAGFPPERVIGVSQYWELRRALGILPFWLFFVGMVGQLMRLGIIKGTDVILDGTTQRLWFHDDPEAGWSFPKPWKGSVWGYKVHTLLCRWSQLPILFLITPANRQECTVAIPLLALSVALFGLPIMIVRADAGYFTLAIMTFIRVTLQASFMIDYNLRRRGKRAWPPCSSLTNGVFTCGHVLSLSVILPGPNDTSAWNRLVGVV